MNVNDRELLQLLGQVVTRLEQIFIESSDPICEIYGSKLRCLHCMGSEGGRKQNQMYDKPTKSKWGKKGGRPRKKKVTVDSITGAVVPSTPEATATATPTPTPANPNPLPHQPGIDPAKFYRPDEAAPLLGVTLNTMPHWRTAKRDLPTTNWMDTSFATQARTSWSGFQEVGARHWPPSAR